MRYFWRVRGYVEEGRRRLERGVDVSAGADEELRARTLAEAGVMAFTASDHDRSRELWLEALPLFERLGSRREIARALMELGATWHAEDDLPRALEYYERSREAMAEVDDPAAMGVVLANLGAAHQALGDLDRAEEATLAALALAEELGDEDGLAITSLNLATLEVELGQLEAAAEHAGVALDKAQRLTSRVVTAYAFGIVAAIARDVGRTEDAGVLSGAFIALFDAIGTAPQREEAQRHEATLARLAGAIDLEAAVERGKMLTVDQAVALAHDVLSGYTERSAG
jgi:tetratricopeptide (TPR) repeat protein